MQGPSNKNGFRTPDGYFDHLPGRVMDRIGRKAEGNGGFRVPENYFETFPDRLAERLAREEVRVRKLWPSRMIWVPAAAAAIAFLLLLVPSGEASLQFEDLAGDTLANYLEAEAFDLSSGELAESLPFGEIAMEDLTDQMPEKQELLDYLENTTDTDDEFYLDRHE